MNTWSCWWKEKWQCTAFRRRLISGKGVEKCQPLSLAIKASCALWVLQVRHSKTPPCVTECLGQTHCDSCLNLFDSCNTCNSTTFKAGSKNIGPHCNKGLFQSLRKLVYSKSCVHLSSLWFYRSWFEALCYIIFIFILSRATSKGAPWLRWR